MIGDLRQSWELFGNALLVGLLLATVLPMLGIVLVLRHQVFLCAAIGQSANLGIAIAIWVGLGGHDVPGQTHERVSSLLGGLLLATSAAVMAMRALTGRASSLEARAVWMFLLAGSGAMLLLADAPHGLQEVQRLMLSSLLGASSQDVWVAAGLVAATMTMVLRWRRAVLLWAMEPASAQVYGQSVVCYDVLVGVWLGGVIGFSIHSTGLTFTFGCTVLPVLLAREVARTLTTVLWLAPVAGALASAGSFVLADRLDLPPGQCCVVVLGGAVAIARVIVGCLAGGTRRASS